MTGAVVVLARGGPAAAEDRALARRLGLPLVTEPAAEVDYVLARTGDRLEIRWNAQRGPGPFSVDFAAGAGARRLAAPSRRLPIARALGVGRGTRTVLDATAGLGRDAFALASLGCRVIAVERNPVVAALLEDGLRRAASQDAERIELVIADAREVLRGLPAAERPDAVLLDPMLGARGSARVKKETRLLQELLGPADDRETRELLALARRTALRRTAVKRPLRAPELAPDVDARIASARVRWDVYLT